MKKKLRMFFIKIINSKLALPFLFVVIFFTVSSMLVLIFEVTHNEQFNDFIDGFWWAIITFSTTGYGDKVPVTLGGRIIAVISIFVGIGIMTFLSGTLASVFVDQNNKLRRGLMDYRYIKDHFVICGWKDNMIDILKEILRLNKFISSSEVIIVSNIESEKIEELKKYKDLKNIGYVKGDYFSESSLLRANIKMAKKIVILADRLESDTPAEVDSKTVLTVLTARALAKDVYICAEILDNKYDPYLRQALCDEILRSRDYSRMIVANSSATNGISQIIYNLISPESGNSKLSTCNIPEEYISRTFRDFKSYFNIDDDKLLVGILENTGSPNKLKREALREAQKTSNVSKLVANLKEVKELVINNPVILPRDDYVIKNNSMGIILTRIN